MWHETSTHLSRGSGLPSAGATAERTSWPDPTQNAEVVGLQIPSDMGRLYAAISGDRNPIHLHPLAAKAFGFRTTIVHGMWTLALPGRSGRRTARGLRRHRGILQTSFPPRGEHVADRSGTGN